MKKKTRHFVTVTLPKEGYRETAMPLAEGDEQVLEDRSWEHLSRFSWAATRVGDSCWVTGLVGALAFVVIFVSVKSLWPGSG
ncbi:hypothetical protein ACFL26_02190 [Patescibacteria group bacterium]